MSVAPLTLFLALARVVWVEIFLVIASRAGTLTGKNVLAAVTAGLVAAMFLPVTELVLVQCGYPVWEALGTEFFAPIFEGVYILLFPPLFALSRRLFKLRGFGRDFWLVTAMMTPMYLVMIGAPLILLLALAFSFAY